MRYAAPLFALLTLTASTPAAAQGDSLATRAPGGTAAQMAALAQLHAGNTVRVHVAGQGWLNGLVAQNHADSLVLGLVGGERVVPTAAIDSMLVRHGHAGMGAGVGALVGMIVGANVGGCEQPPARSLGEAAASIGPQLDCGLGHMMAGLAVGALVGAIVGAATPSWEHLVPVNEPRRDAPSPLVGH
jgi:hypothetical protein